MGIDVNKGIGTAYEGYVRVSDCRFFPVVTHSDTLFRNCLWTLNKKLCTEWHHYNLMYFNCQKIYT